MNIVIGLLYVIEVIVCLLLVGVVLLQRTKGTGGAMAMGGGMGEAIFGAQVGNVLTKATVILGIVFLANTLVLSVLTAQQRGPAGSSSLMDSERAPARSAEKIKERLGTELIPITAAQRRLG